MEEIIYYLGKVFNFILVFFVIILMLFFLFKLTIKKSDLKNGKIKLYGIFMGLKNNEILSVSALTIKYIFIIWCILSTNEDNYIYLSIMILLDILYNLPVKRFLNIIFSLINSVVIYISLICKNTFFEYINEVMFEWYVLSLGIFLCIFIGIYSSYFFIKNLNHILKNNKFINMKNKSS